MVYITKSTKKNTTQKLRWHSQLQRFQKHVQRDVSKYLIGKKRVPPLVKAIFKLASKVSQSL